PPGRDGRVPGAGQLPRLLLAHHPDHEPGRAGLPGLADLRLARRGWPGHRLRHLAPARALRGAGARSVPLRFAEVQAAMSSAGHGPEHPSLEGDGIDTKKILAIGLASLATFALSAVVAYFIL